MLYVTEIMLRITQKFMRSCGRKLRKKL